MNNYQWNSRGRLVPKAACVLEVSEVTVLAAQVKALSKNIDCLSLQKPIIVMTCKTCEGRTYNYRLPDSRSSI